MAEEEITVTLTVRIRTFDHPERAARLAAETQRRLSLAFSDVEVTEAWVVKEVERRLRESCLSPT